MDSNLWNVKVSVRFLTNERLLNEPTCVSLISLRGRFLLLTGTRSIVSRAESTPSITFPNIVYLVSRCGCLEYVMKNWDLFVLGPELAMATTPRALNCKYRPWICMEYAVKADSIPWELTAVHLQRSRPRCFGLLFLNLKDHLFESWIPWCYDERCSHHSSLKHRAPRSSEIRMSHQSTRVGR